MEFKGTKGEWKVFKEVGYDLSVTCNDFEIVDFMFSEVSDAEKEANAKLIACAPELLEALKRSNKQLAEFYNTLDFEGYFAIRSLMDKNTELIQKATTI